MKKLNGEKVRKIIENEGYKLLSEYKDCRTKLKTKCSNGHIHYARYHDFIRGHRCQLCYNKRRGNSLRHSYERIKYKLELEGYELLSKTYENAFSKLEVKCSEGHIYKVRYNDFQQGARCPYCCRTNASFTYDYVKNFIEDTGYILHSKEYINSSTPLKVECLRGHKYKVPFIRFSRGGRCYICHRQDRVYKRGKEHHNWHGGISAAPYCFEWKSKEYKEEIKERDKYNCLNPICWNNSDILVIHHINYNKKSCHPWNLITLCNSCNSRANTDRDWWQAWYSLIIQKRYNYAVQIT